MTKSIKNLSPDELALLIEALSVAIQTVDSLGYDATNGTVKEDATTKLNELINSI